MLTTSTKEAYGNISLTKLHIEHKDENGNWYRFQFKDSLISPSVPKIIGVAPFTKEGNQKIRIEIHINSCL
jgi:hypothetical protein